MNELAKLATQGWVSLRQFSTIVGVSYITACKMRDNRNIAVIKVGGIYRVTADEVRRFLKEGNLKQENS